MPLKYLADITELLTSKKFMCHANNAGFSVQATIKIELIPALYCTIILLFIWCAVIGLWHRVKLIKKLHDPNQLHPFQNDAEDELPVNSENFANDHVTGTGDPTDVKDETTTNKAESFESWNEPIVRCYCC